MRILLDECVNAGVKAAFPGHAVKTAPEMGWGGAEDGALLLSAQRSFDVFVTIDRKLENRHDLKKLRLGIVLAHVPSNKLSSYEPIFAALLEAALKVKAGRVIHVTSAELPRAR